MPEPLRHNFVNGINHLIDERWWGDRTIGKKSPIQAYYDGVSDNYAICWPEVIDWPFTEDEIGVAFDQGSIYGLRTRCIRLSDGGEDDFLVAVPRLLPEGYTRMGRCDILASINSSVDYIGDSPLTGVYNGGPVYWRGPDGIAPWPDGYTWLPMNFNQKTWETPDYTGGTTWWSETVATVTVNEPGNACNGSIGSSSSSDIRNWVLHTQVTNHIGFRGGKLIAYFYETDGLACQRYWHLGMRIVVGWDNDPGPTAPDLPANIVFDNEYQVGDLVEQDIPSGSGYTEYWKLEVTLPEMLNPIGVKDRVWTILIGSQTVGDSLINESTASYLSPRTDVPMWFFSATGNKCAPGGVIS